MFVSGPFASTTTTTSASRTTIAALSTVRGPNLVQRLVTAAGDPRAMALAVTLQISPIAVHPGVKPAFWRGVPAQFERAEGQEREHEYRDRTLERASQIPSINSTALAVQKTPFVSTHRYWDDSAIDAHQAVQINVERQRRNSAAILAAEQVRDVW